MPQENVTRFPGPQATRFTPNPHGRHGYPNPEDRKNQASLSLMCRRMTPAVVELLHTIIKGEHPDATVGDQLKAVQLVLDRGFGRAVSVVEMTVTERPREVKQLTREELVRLANGETLVLEGEFKELTPETVEQTVNG
jgi:hypothetical protein